MSQSIIARKRSAFFGVRRALLLRRAFYALGKIENSKFGLTLLNA